MAITLDQSRAQQSAPQNLSDAAAVQRGSNELVKLIRKLRWIGMEEEAERLQAELTERHARLPTASSPCRARPIDHPAISAIGKVERRRKVGAKRGITMVAIEATCHARCDVGSGARGSIYFNRNVI